jgi:3D (Asp-Asp-Asp) domain-containing protein
MFSFPTILFVICTAYTAAFDECGKTDGITACGQPAIQGVTVACDGLPFGTEVVIDGHTYIVQDRFGGNYGKSKIDIYMDKKEDALKFGRQIKIVEVKDNATKTTAERNLFTTQERKSYFPYR